MRRLEPNDLLDFLDLPLNAILATYRKDGQVLLSPVWHEWRDGGFNIIIGADDVKHRHLTRNPRASVIVMEHGGLNRTIEVRGIATVSREVPEEMNWRICLRYLGPDQTPAYLDRMKGVPEALVRLEPNWM